MKVNKNIFICALLVLMLFLCINATSAEEPLDTNLTSTDASNIVSIDDDDVVASDSSSEVLSEGEIIVGDGGYSSISAAVGAANGGETIFIKNGVYDESRITNVNKQLTFTGESKEGTIIKASSSTTGFFFTGESGYTSLTFNNLTFKDIAGGASGPVVIGGNGDVTIKNCIFDGCTSKYGAFRIYTSGIATVEDCKILNSKSTSTTGSSGFTIAGSGSGDCYVKNVFIDNAQASNNNYGVVYLDSSSHTVNIENLTIVNSNGNVLGAVYTKGNTNIKNSNFSKNTFSRENSGVLYVNGAKSLTVESSVISDNSGMTYLLTTNGASTLDLNYNNIHDNVVATSYTNPNSGTYALNANYWGSNALPDGVTATTWVVENNGNYELNTGEALAKDIPELTGGDEPEPGHDVYVSPDGNGDGLSYQTPMSDFNQALNIVSDGGTVHILNGEYNISSPIMVNKNVSFVGESRDGVIMSCSANAGLFLIGYDINTFADLHLGSVSISSISFLNYDNIIAYTYSSVDELSVTNCIIDPKDDDLIFIQVGIDAMWSPSCDGTLNFKNNVLTSNATVAVYGAFNANINDNILIGGIIVNYTSGTLNADYNYWGSETPQNELSLNNWIKFTAGTATPEIYNDESATISIAATLNDGVTGAGSYLPDYPITATLSATGTLSDDSVTLVNGAKDVTYSSTSPISDNVNINVLGQSLSVPITVKERYTGIIYVNDETGNDGNDGSQDTKVKTLSKAIELAGMGIGKIIVDAGTYTIDSTLNVVKDLDIAGEGDVIINGASKKIIENTANLNLTNIKFTGGAATDSCVLLNKGNATLQSCEVYSNAYPAGYGASIIRNNDALNNLVIENSKFHDNNAIYGTIYNNKGNVILNNSEIYGNDMSEYTSATSPCAVNNVAGQVTIQNTNITDNKGRRIVSSTASGFGASQVKGTLVIINTTFDSNTASGTNGGAVYAENSIVSIENSTFTNGTATKGTYSGGQGGAIYSQGSTITVNSSVFKNNTAVEGGNDIYMYSGSIDIANSVLLNANGKSVEINSGNAPTVNANDNFWGDNAEANVGSGITVDRWVILNAKYTPSEVSVGDEVTIDASFNQTNSSTGVSDYAGKLPDGIEISVVSTTGDIATLTTKDGSATTTYTIANGDEEINLTAGNDVVVLPVTAETPSGIVYVSATGDDAKDGLTEENAVATLNHAIEIATNQIVILEGEYTVTSLLNITKDLNITGAGDVTVKSNAVTTITYQEWNDWDEEWETKTKTVYTLIENNANLNISNIKFTLVPASLSQELILNNANLLVNTSEFNNIKITSSKGVIQNANGAKLELNGTTFKSASGTYGAINNNGELLVNNSKFLDADRSGDSGVYSTAITSYNQATILNSEFKNNKGTLGGAVYVMYSYTLKENPVMIIDNCTFEDNKAAGSQYSSGSGAAVKCSGNQVTLTITNSTFVNNTATGDGGAIYAQGTVNIDQCVFMDNNAASSEAVYAYGGTVDIANSIILEDGNAINRYESTYSTPATITANNNWWGSNDAPANVGENIAVDAWVKMDASFAPATAQAGDEVTVTATFDNDKLPSGVIDVTFTSTSGNLNEAATVENAQASVTYTIDANDESITATSASASVVMPIQAPAPAGAIYVSYENGNDANDGSSEATAVKTIAHAIELADDGAGKIILLEGTHVIDATLKVEKDLDMAGQGNAVVNGNSLGILENSANLNLTNIIFTNAKLATGSIIKDNGNTTIDGCTFYNCNTTSTSAAGPINNLKGTMTINNSKFYALKGARGVIASQGGTKFIMNNSEVYDNDCTSFTNSYGIVRLEGCEATIENTIFRNNKAKQGAGLWLNRAGSHTMGSLNANNLTFIGNIAHTGNGAAIYVSSASSIANGFALNVNGSRFINNLANASAGNVGGIGSAIYMTAGPVKVTVTQSVFINNSATSTINNDAAIYVGAGTLDISDSIILTNDGDTRFAINKNGGSVTAENNWWGNNDQANTNADVSKIVKMTVTLDPEDAEAGDAVTIAVAFDNENLPKDVINVSFTSSSGSLNEVVTMNGPAASVNYAGDASDLSITVKSSQAEKVFKFDPEAGIIFVLPGAEDTNPGTRDAPVGTIAHALEIASEGKIVLLEGVHKTGDLGVLINDMTITGEGNAVIDAQNNNRILQSDANVVIINVTMINGFTADEEGGLLANTNELTLINCTLANSSAPEKCGGAINNLGKLTIINTTIANCSAKYGGAVFIQDQYEFTSVTIINSTFENNVATGKEQSTSNNLGGGAIYAQRGSLLYDLDLTIENTTFTNNQALNSCGGAIALEQLDSTVKITGCEFVSNRASGTEAVGGAIYTKSATPYQRGGTMIITGTLFEENTCDEDGGAIYARTTTVNIANSILVNNTDANGLAVYGYKSEQTNPAITLNDNWWGTNDSPKDLIGGNSYKPTLNRWAILTVTNSSEIKAGETVQLTVSINSYTDGTNNGTLSKPIAVKRAETITTTFGDIEGVLENGEFVYDLAVPEGLKYIAVNVDGETVVLYVVTTNVTVELEDITAKKFELVEVTVNVKADDESEINVGNVELYIGNDLIATIPVSANKAIKEILFAQNEGTYNLTAKYVEETNLFGLNQTNATLTIEGLVDLTNETFFNFFDENGNLRLEFNDNELVFHGEFSDLGVNVITIPKTVSLRGDNAVLYDMAYALTGDDIKLSDITLVADGADFTSNHGAAVYASGAGIEINNLTVNYTAPGDKEAFGVLVKSCEEFKLTDSEINFDANNRADLIHQAAVIIADSSDVEIKGNLINASLPARNVAFNYYYPDLNGIYQDLVLGVGIQGGENINFTDNEVFVDAKSAEGKLATLDSFMVDGTKNVLIKGNNFTQTDFTGEGKAGYANVVDLYNFNGILVESNNILVNTTTGENGAGTAYPIQATGPYTGLVITKNNLTSISKGPALGIFSQNYDGVTDIEVTFNNINVTGYATDNEYALVSGMELQDTVAKVYYNTINVQSISAYDEANQLYGISYAQSTSGGHTYDIQNNTVITDGKYSVYLLNAADSNVIGNTLFAHELAGDESVKIGSGEGNVVKDNIPPYDAEIIIDAANVWIGNNNEIIVNITDATGTVTIKVNEKEFKDLVLTEGIVSQIVDAADLVAGINTVEVFFTSTNALIKSGNAESTFMVLNGVVTQDTYEYYFNQKDGGKLFDYVPEGATLDFQGSIINPDSEIEVNMNVTKPVNIISTTKDAFVDLNTISKDGLGKNPGNRFTVSHGGSGSNITGIFFHNTQLWISNTSNVIFDNISVVAEGQNIGNGVGVTSIRDNSSFITVKNSYFFSKDNGRASTLVLAWAENCTIDNNTLKGEGAVGNLFYLNVYNIYTYPETVMSFGSAMPANPVNNYNKIINNRIYGIQGSSTSVGLMVEGTYNIIQNNTLYKSSIGASFGAMRPANNSYIGNTMTEGGSLTAQTNSIVYNNNVTGSLTSGTNSVAYNNTVGNGLTASANSVVYNNTIGGALTAAAGATVYNNTAASFKTSGANSIIKENEINGDVTIGHKNTTFANNNVTGIVTVNADENRIIENTIISTGTYAVDLKAKKNNNVTDNILYSSELNSDAAVSYSDDTNIVKDNYPITIDVIVEATDVFEGQATVITVTVPDATGNVTIRVNGREVAVVNLTEGVATFETAEYGNNYTVNVTYNGDLKYLPNTNVTTFSLIGNVVTNDTFYTYFSEEGILRDEVSYDELIFKGEFSDLAAGYIIITKPVKITGDDAKLINLGINIASSDVALDKLTLNATTALGDLIAIYEVDNVNITNLNISYAVDDEDAIAVNVVKSSNVNISDNTIYFESHVTMEGTSAIGINVEGANNIIIDNNDIEASLSSVDSNWALYTKYGMMGIDTVNPLRVDSSKSVEITNNDLNVALNGFGGSNPTVQAAIILGSEDVLFDSNNVTMIDTVTPNGEASYLYGLVLGLVDDSTISNNNFYMSTEGGKNAVGAAYPINIVTSSLDIVKNNITSVSNGPNIGIYVGMSYDYEHMMDEFEITVKENNIDITGLATSKSSTALISGIEAGAGAVTITENNISVANKAGYVENAPVHGVSYVQSAWIPEFDIQNNNIVVNDGDYAVSVNYGRGVETTVKNNYLIAHELYGDEAVSVKDLDASEIENNRPYVPELKVIVENITVGEDAIINVVFNEDATGNVVVIVDGKTYNVDNIVDGKGNVTVSGLTASDYTVGAIFTSADSNYGDSENSTVFNVAKMTSDVSIDVSGAELGSNATIAVSIPGATGNVTVIVNGKEESITLDENGNATYTIENIPADDYSVVVIYPGDETHELAYAAETFTVSKLESEVNVTADSEIKVGVETTISVNVTEGATGTVIIKVGDTEYAIDLSQTDNVTVAFDKAGEYSVVATYNGDDKHNASVSEIATIVVSDKAPANIQVEIVSKDNLAVGDEIEIIVKADTDAELIVMVNGKEINSGSNGILSASLNSILKAAEESYKFTAGKAGIYNVTVLAKENDEFTSEVYSEVFYVAKKDAELNIAPIADAKIGDKVNINVDSDTDGDVTIKVNGETVTGEYEITKAGAYTITVESAATDAYNAGFATYTFNVEEEPATNITVVVDGKEYNAEIINGTPTVTTDPVDNNITVVVDGKEYPAEVVDGKAVVTTDPVDNNITVVVDGKEYPAEVVDGKAVIDTNATEPEKTPASVTVPESIKPGESASVDVSIPGATGNVSVIVDGVETIVPLDENGTASVALDNVSAGDHSVVVVYSGDETHAPTYSASSFSVPEEPVVIPKASEFSEITVSDDQSISFVLKDADGKVIANAPITYTVNGKANTTTTDKDGKFVIAGENGAVIAINYAGNDSITGTNTTLKLNTHAVPEVVKVVSQFNISGRSITINGYAVDGPADEQGIYYATVLLDADGKPISNAFIEFAVNNKIYNRTTNENGSFNPYKLNMIRAGRYTMAFNFAGDDNYTNAFACVCVDLDKKPITIKAAAKSYKAATKTKKYTVTLSTIKGLDGKMYLSPKKVTLTVNGKTFSGKTNSKGKVTFKITNLNKKGKYTAKISYKGDKTYEEASKKVKLTIK